MAINLRDPARLRLAGWSALLLLGVAVYTLGLGGQYIPTNGDELVYSHIARLTAASGHWLPLVSDLAHMRNTKPPLLFWQAMLAGDWGAHWSQFALRLPSLLYTLLVTAALAGLTGQITGQRSKALLAGCLYLAFFSTFRYGRPYLTSAPETFWFSLPLFWLLWKTRPDSGAATGARAQPGTAGTAGDFGWPAHLAIGLFLGLGLAYKSFALIVPAGATLWCALLLSAPALSWQRLLQTSGKVALSSVMALALFALWFALDPQPQAVWAEFVVGENAGKLASSQGYWHTALYGGDYSLWAQALAYVQNAGLLCFVVLGLAWAALRAWRTGQPRTLSEQLLWVWLAVWLLVFMLPSQRSARYVIPAMPALAMLLALYWERIARGWFLLSLGLSALFVVVLGRIAWASHTLAQSGTAELALAMLPVAAAVLALLAGSLRPACTRACSVLAALCVYACFYAAVAPLDGAPGRYSQAVQAQVQRQRIAVPNGFNGQFERFEFLLAGNRFVPYDADARLGSDTPDEAQRLRTLLQTHDAVIWLQATAGQSTPPCLPACTLLGERWEVKGRHRSGEITLANLWWPQQWLFRREWLLCRAD